MLLAYYLPHRRKLQLPGPLNSVAGLSEFLASLLPLLLGHVAAPGRSAVVPPALPQDPHWAGCSRPAMATRYDERGNVYLDTLTAAALLIWLRS